MGRTTLLRAMPEAAWQAIVRRDRREDGRFVFAVQTTGIFCRPSCPARRALRENVSIFPTPSEAQSAGFRPCLRCHPMNPPSHATLVAKTHELVKAHIGRLTTGDIAQRMNVSTSTLRRAFLATTGMSFSDFARSERLEKGHARVAEGATVRQAAKAAGLSSAAKLYLHGAKPTAARPRQQTIRYTVAPTLLGPLLVASTSKGLRSVRFGRDRAALVAELRLRYMGCDLQPADQELQSHVDEIARRIAGRPPSRDLPLDIQATAFRLRVWKELAQIPRGATLSYSELAQRAGNPKAVRAVASACAANELAVVIPCHRILGKDGTLTGYRWGIERKRSLLEAEAKETDV